MPKGLLSVSPVLLALAPEQHIYESLREDILRAKVCTQLCTGGYTYVYTPVYFYLLGSSCILGQYIARVQVFLSSV